MRGRAAGRQVPVATLLTRTLMLAVALVLGLLVHALGQAAHGAEIVGHESSQALTTSDLRTQHAAAAGQQASASGHHAGTTVDRSAANASVEPAQEQPGPEGTQAGASASGPRIGAAGHEHPTSPCGQALRPVQGGQSALVVCFAPLAIAPVADSPMLSTPDGVGNLVRAPDLVRDLGVQRT